MVFVVGLVWGKKIIAFFEPPKAEIRY
jgi:hypothetical protein